MPNSINQDNIGNFYLGFRTSLETGLLITGGQASPSVFTAFLSTAFGAGGNLELVSGFSHIRYIRPPAPFETLTGARGRFRVGLEGWGQSTQINASNADSQIDISGSSQGGSGLPGNYYLYAVANNFSIAWFLGNQSGTALGNNFKFAYHGWVKDPLFTGNLYPLNAVSMITSNNTSTSPIIDARRPTLPNSTTPTNLSIASDAITNYSISCETTTPGANTTDLIVRDAASPNRAIGRCYNLLKTSLNIPIGQIYRNDTLDPDGSDNPYWICVANLGSERILMRVWTEDI